jgi:hypothetical protein
MEMDSLNDFEEDETEMNGDERRLVGINKGLLSSLQASISHTTAVDLSKPIEPPTFADVSSNRQSLAVEEEIFLDLRQYSTTNILDALRSASIPPSCINLSGSSLDAKALAILSEFISSARPNSVNLVS